MQNIEAELWVIKSWIELKRCPLSLGGRAEEWGRVRKWLLITKIGGTWPSAGMKTGPFWPLSAGNRRLHTCGSTFSPAPPQSASGSQIRGVLSSPTTTIDHSWRALASILPLPLRPPFSSPSLGDFALFSSLLLLCPLEVHSSNTHCSAWSNHCGIK